MTYISGSCLSAEKEHYIEGASLETCAYCDTVVLSRKITPIYLQKAGYGIMQVPKIDMGE